MNVNFKSIDEVLPHAERYSIHRILHTYARKSGSIFTMGDNANMYIDLKNGEEYKMNMDDFVRLLEIHNNHVFIKSERTDLGNRYTLYVNCQHL